MGVMKLAALATAALLHLAVAPAPASAGVEVAQAEVADQGAVKGAVGVLQISQTAWAKLSAEKQALEARYQQELAEVDRLKNGRASWRRDRQIREQMAKSLETAKKLAAVSRSMQTLAGKMTTERGTLLAAIERELKRSVTTERRRWLVQEKSKLEQVLRRATRRIVLPDDSIDPLADPEELEQQAALLAQTEAQLASEIKALDEQAARYRRMSALRSKHARADEMGAFEDDGPRRTSGRPSDARGDGGGAGALSDSEASPPEGPTPAGDKAGLGFDDQASALAEIILPTTVDALRRAERSSDPKIKAEAADAARAEVVARLKKLRDRRAQIEKRARMLKGK